MRIRRLVARNYRTLRDIDLEFHDDYCTLSGRNNAGKSCVIRLLMALFGSPSEFVWPRPHTTIDYKEDKTQWVNDETPIDIRYHLELSAADDPALIAFIELVTTCVSGS